MTMILTTENEDRIVQETIPGVTGASTLNDTRVSNIVKYDFDTDPETDGWLIGSGWAWSAANDNIEAV